MPDPTAFSQEQTGLIIAALQGRTPSRRCPCCDQQAWTLANGIVQLPISPTPQAFGAPGPRVPCVALVCNTCGDVRLISLLAIGLGHLAGAQGATRG